MSGAQTLAGSLRQMLAVLETERQALAAMDVDALLVAVQDKHGLCRSMESDSHADLDAECRSLLEAARHQNEVNRRIRNILAANLSARLDALRGMPGTYARPASQRA